MIKPLALSLLLCLNATPLLASDCASILSAEQCAYNTQLETNGADHAATQAALQTLIAKFPDGSWQARSLTFRLAASYYRQLRYTEAEALIALVADNGPYKRRNPSASNSTTDAMAALVRKGDPGAALVLGEAAVRRDTAALEAARRALAATTTAASEEAGTNAHRLVIEKAYELAESSSVVAELHHAMKHFPEAEKMYVASLALFGETASAARDPLIRTRTGLAMLYRSQGKAAEALPLQEAALADLLALNGPQHPDVIESETELGYIRAQIQKAH